MMMVVPLLYLVHYFHYDHLIMCLKMLCKTPKANGFADHYPNYPGNKWLFHWEYTLFSDKPMCCCFWRWPLFLPAGILSMKTIAYFSASLTATKMAGDLFLLWDPGQPKVVSGIFWVLTGLLEIMIIRNHTKWGPWLTVPSRGGWRNAIFPGRAQLNQDESRRGDSNFFQSTSFRKT